MSGLKYLVIVLFVESIRSYPLPIRNVRSLQVQPSYGYPLQYPYGTAFPVQPRFVPPPPPIGHTQIYPVYQTNYPSPNGNSQIYPINQPNGNSQIYPINQPNYPVNSPYPPFGPFYPQFPNYPYPSYPSYPFQPNFPNYPDPFAHIPTEIIDVDENGNFNPELSWENEPSKVEITSSQHSTASNPLRPVSTQIIESKPIQTAITRTFDSHSSEPKIDVQYTDSNSNTGSGTLIEATGDETENKDQNDNEGKQDASQEEKKEEGAEEENKKKGGSLFSWG